MHIEGSGAATANQQTGRKELPSTRRSHLTWVEVLLLFAASAFSPLKVMASNPLDIGHPERLLLLIGLIWCGGVFVVLVLIRFGTRSSTAVYSTIVAICLVVTGGDVIFRLGDAIGLVGLSGLVAAIAALIARIENHGPLRVVFISLTAFLLSGPAIALASAVSDLGDPVEFAHQGDTLELSVRPDVFVVVVDAYGGRLTFSHQFGIEGPAVDRLKDRGFEVPSSAWSSYPSTRSSAPSLLDMSYPLFQSDRVSTRANASLSDIMGGSNAISGLLQAHGYETVMIESGWSGSRCGPTVDRCVASPFLDEAVFSVVEKSIVGPAVLRSAGYSFTVGSQQTMKWLLENAGALSMDDRPTFVFAHVMAPHPPFFLDESCQTTFSPERSGVVFARGSDDIEKRLDGYLEQAKCIDDFMVALGDTLDSNDVLVYVGDHGTDARRQLERDPATWTRQDLIERYNVFLAIRTDSNCVVGSPVMIPNVLRRIMSCMSLTSLPDLEPRMFKYAGFNRDVQIVLEVDEDDVRALLAS